MIYYFTPNRSLFSIPASNIAASFVALDFVSFIIQLVGGSMAGPDSPPEDQLRAIHIYMGGIGLQEFFIVVFLGLAVKFWMEMNKVEKGAISGPLRQTRWRPLLFTLFGSLMFISVSQIFEPASIGIAHEGHAALTVFSDPHHLPLRRVLGRLQ
jgi:hypothetical protein